MRREPLTRQLRDLPPGAVGRGPCWQGSRGRAGSATLWSRAGASVMVISGVLGLEASEARVTGGLFSTSGRPPGLCRFMCSFLMWCTTAAALKACCGDTGPAFPLPRGLLMSPLFIPERVQGAPASAGKARGEPPPQLPQPSLGAQTDCPPPRRGPHPPLALGKVLLDLEADGRVDVPVEGCVPVNPVDAEGTPGEGWLQRCHQGLGRGLCLRVRV